METVETFFDKFGLMAGDGADKKRMVIGALGAGFILTYFKPEMMFHEGKIRPWSWLESDGEQHPTGFTLWHGMVVGAFITGVLI